MAPILWGNGPKERFGVERYSSPGLPYTFSRETFVVLHDYLWSIGGLYDSHFRFLAYHRCVVSCQGVFRPLFPFWMVGGHTFRHYGYRFVGSGCPNGLIFLRFFSWILSPNGGTYLQTTWGLIPTGEGSVYPRFCRVACN